jgi:hypothetical protein
MRRLKCKQVAAAEPALAAPHLCPCAIVAATAWLFHCPNRTELRGKSGRTASTLTGHEFKILTSTCPLQGRHLHHNSRRSAVPMAWLSCAGDIGPAAHHIPPAGDSGAKRRREEECLDKGTRPHTEQQARRSSACFCAPVLSRSRDSSRKGSPEALSWHKRTKKLRFLMQFPAVSGSFAEG